MVRSALHGSARRQYPLLKLGCQNHRSLSGYSCEALVFGIALLRTLDVRRQIYVPSCRIYRRLDGTGIGFGCSSGGDGDMMMVSIELVVHTLPRLITKFGPSLGCSYTSGGESVPCRSVCISSLSAALLNRPGDMHTPISDGNLYVSLLSRYRPPWSPPTPDPTWS